MQTIPAINCEDFACVKDKLNRIAELFNDVPREASAKGGWVHIDIADGKFTPRVLWNNPSELIANCKLQIEKLNLEIHLMVSNPEIEVKRWLPVGIKRIIAHLEALSDEASVKRLQETCKKANVELGLAIKPDTPAEAFLPYLKKIAFVQTLGVNPGWAGQSAQPNSFNKIKELKRNHPEVTVEMDGGVNLEVAKRAKEAGADIAVSASFLWGSKDPQAAYKKLQAL